MRPVDLLAIAAFATLAIPGGGCAPQERGRVRANGAAGTAATGAAGTSATGTAGTSPPGVAGTSGAAGTAPSTPSGVDDGRLFHDAAVLPALDSTPAADAGRLDSGAPAMPTATLRIGGLGLTAVFTQKGTDVTMAVTATNCSQGSHVIEIHGGFSCDNAGTQGPVWDGKRGAGIPALTCGADRRGTLMYTRSGADPATAWTVGDHATKTDVTLHPAIASGNCGTFF
jgi:hypothetical protein